MNRRDFVHHGTALLGAAALASPASPVAAAESARRPKIGFLGVEYSHAAEKIRLLRQSTDFELVGVWAETDVLRETYARQGVRTASAEEILAECEVVAVESAVRSHAALARRALEAGRHVHLEKPPATNLAEFDELVRLAKEKQLRLQVGYMWRHNPGLIAAFEAVRSGWLGDVYLVRARINNTLDARRRAEWAEFPGGVLFELGSHLIDAVVRLLGRPERVTAFLKTHGSTTDALADNNLAVLEYPRATALVTSATLQPNSGAHRAFEICGTRGTAVVRPLEPPALELDLAQAAGPYRAGPQSVPQPEYRRYAAEFVELARSVRSGDPLPVSPDEERTIQETLLRACRVI
jgi:predicted dehydrogenase